MMLTKFWRKKLLNLFLITSLVFLFNIPFFSTGIDGFSHPRNSLTLLPIIIWILLSQFVFPQKTINLQNFFIYIACAILFFIAVFFHNETNYLVYYIAFSAVFISSIKKAINGKFKILKIAFISIFIQLLYGYFQEFYLYQLDWNYTSESRPTGGVFQVNVYSSILVTGVLLSYFIYRSSSKLKYLIYCYLTLTPTMLMLTQSRIGLVTFILGLLSIALFQLYYTTKNKRRSWWIALLIGILISISVNFSSSESSNKELTKDPYRVSLYEHSLWMLKEKPILGWGFSNYAEKFHYSHVERYNNGNIQQYISGYTTHPHNELLFWLSSSGVIGTLSALILLIAAVYLSYRINRIKTTITLIITLPVILHCMTEYPLYSSAQTAIITLIVIASYLPTKRIYINSSIALASITTKLFFIITFTAFLITNFNYSIKASEMENNLDLSASVLKLLINPHLYNIIQYRLLVEETLNPQDNINREELNKKIVYFLDEYAKRELVLLYNFNCLKIDNCDNNEITRLFNLFPELKVEPPISDQGVRFKESNQGVRVVDR